MLRSFMRKRIRRGEALVLANLGARLHQGGLGKAYWGCACRRFHLGTRRCCGASQVGMVTHVHRTLRHAWKSTFALTAIPV